MSRHTTPESYFESHEAWMLQAFYEVRSILRECLPQLEESMKFMCPFFSYKGLFCFIAFNQKHKRLVLGFCNGYALSDYAGKLLADEGQQYIRHWVLEADKKLDEDILRAYIHESILVQDELYRKRVKK